MAETTITADKSHVGDGEITRQSADTMSSPEIELELPTSAEVRRALSRENTDGDDLDFVSIQDDGSDRAGSSNAGDVAENSVLTSTEDKQGHVTPEGSQSPLSLHFQPEDSQVTSSCNSVTSLKKPDLEESERNSSPKELQPTTYETESRKTQPTDSESATVGKLSVTESETENQKSTAKYNDSIEQQSLKNTEINEEQSKIENTEPSLQQFKETQPEEEQSTVNHKELTTQQVTVRDIEAEIQQISHEVSSEGQRCPEITSEGGVVHISTGQEVLQKRLETLIQENNQKNLKIIQLQEDLLSLTQQLRTAETKSKSSDTLPYQLETPRSKTCVIL